MTLKEYCIRNNLHTILDQWNESGNPGQTPETLSAFSHRSIAWRCIKGHVWQAAVKDRTQRRSGCPYCAGRIAVKDQNNLAVCCPAVAAEWHPEKNGAVRPEDVTVGSDRLFWWQCRLGHEWKASAENRALKGNACPYCSGKRAWPGYNDLATEYPQLMKEWYFEYNKDVDPSKIRSHSAKKVYWKCAQGHVWEAYIYNRTSRKQTGCPICAGNVKKEAYGVSEFYFLEQSSIDTGNLHKTAEA